MSAEFMGSYDLCLYYTTFNSEEVAKSVARSLVQEKYAACANVFTSVTSMHEWQGEFHESDEYIVIFTTHKDKSAEFCEELNKRHPYEVPGIIRLATDQCNKPIYDWVKDTVFLREV